MNNKHRLIGESVTENGKMAYMKGNIPIRVSCSGLMLQHKAYELSCASDRPARVEQITVPEGKTRGDYMVYVINEFDYNGAPDVEKSIYNEDAMTALTILPGTYLVLSARLAKNYMAVAVMLYDGVWIAIAGAGYGYFFEGVKIDAVIYTANEEPRQPIKKLPTRAPRLSTVSALRLLAAAAREGHASARSGVAVFDNNTLLHARPSMSGIGNSYFKPRLMEFEMDEERELMRFNKEQSVPYMYSGKYAELQYVIFYHRRTWWIMVNDETSDSVNGFISFTTDTVDLNKQRHKVSKLSDDEMDRMLFDMWEKGEAIGEKDNRGRRGHIRVGQIITKDGNIPALRLNGLDDFIGGAAEMFGFAHDIAVPYIKINDRVVFYYNNEYMSADADAFDSLTAQNFTFREMTNSGVLCESAESDINMDSRQVAMLMEKEGVHGGKFERAKDIKVPGYTVYVPRCPSNTTILMHNAKTGELRFKGDLMSGISFVYTDKVKDLSLLSDIINNELNNPQSDKFKATELIG